MNKLMVSVCTLGLFTPLEVVAESLVVDILNACQVQQNVSYRYWTRADHKGVYHEKRSYYEGMGGFGTSCQYGSTRYDLYPFGFTTSGFFSVDAMTNSQRRSTIVFALGKRVTVADWNGVKVYGGIAATAINYDKPLGHHNVFGVAPIGHVGASFEVPSGWTRRLSCQRLKLGAEHHILPMRIRTNAFTLELVC